MHWYDSKTHSFLFTLWHTNLCSQVKWNNYLLTHFSALRFDSREKGSGNELWTCCFLPFRDQASAHFFHSPSAKLHYCSIPTAFPIICGTSGILLSTYSVTTAICSMFQHIPAADSWEADRSLKYMKYWKSYWSLLVSRSLDGCVFLLEWMLL